MATFLPTAGALRDIAKALECEPDDPAVVAVFDQLVLSGHLLPWLPGWWELYRLTDPVVRKIARRSGVIS